MSSNTEQLWSLSTGVRRIFERTLRYALSSSQTEGTCLYAAVLMRACIAKFLGFDALIRGGSGDEASAGYRDSTGTMHGHYWVECATPDGVIVVDVTADQFGAAPVVVVRVLEARATYVPGDQTLVDEHVSTLMCELDDGSEATLLGRSTHAV